MTASLCQTATLSLNSVKQDLTRKKQKKKLSFYPFSSCRDFEIQPQTLNRYAHVKLSGESYHAKFQRSHSIPKKEEPVLKVFVESKNA